MAVDFDNFPVYDILVKRNVYMSDVWSDFFATFVQTLQGYLSQNGIFFPNLTTAQRDALQNAELGQTIYNTDTNSVETYYGNWGLVAPRITTAQRDALTNVINGQLIYNITSNKFQGYENGSWSNLI